MQFFKVGGCVRDHLMGLQPKDVDWVVIGGSVEEMEEQGFEKVGSDFPVFLHPDTGEEYALARTEKKVGNGYHGFSTRFGPDVTLMDDLQRRDFTINAMAMSEDDLIVDGTGYGLWDLRDHIFRHVNLDDDPVRVLRLARFLCRDWAADWVVHPQTAKLCESMKDQMSHLTVERVWMEMVKAMKEPNSHRFFEFLNEVGVLEVVFPEVFALTKATENLNYHPEGNAFAHTMLVLKQAELRRGMVDDIVMLKMAALTHDLGKGLTPPELMPKHHGHDKVGARVTEEFLTRMKAPSRMIKLLPKIARHHMKLHILHDLRTVKVLDTLVEFQAVHTTQDVNMFVNLGICDRRGRLGTDNEDVRDLDLLNQVSEVLRTPVNHLMDQFGMSPIVKGEEPHVIKERIRRARLRAVATHPFLKEMKEKSKENYRV